MVEPTYKWSHEYGPVNITYTWTNPPEDRGIENWWDEEEIKNLAEYEHFLHLGKKFKFAPLGAGQVSEFADWIEKGENTEIIVKCFRDIVKLVEK